jgi:hypothetical protein
MSYGTEEIEFAFIEKDELVGSYGYFQEGKEKILIKLFIFCIYILVTYVSFLFNISRFR